MGLGKTIQALALVLARPSTDPARKTTLIIAPLALLRQWEKEIDTKIKPEFKLKTTILHGRHTKKRSTPLSELLEHDIVICTYGKLRSEYRIVTKHLDKNKLRILDPRAKFHRVILDEAHNIKNRDSLVSRAAAALQARYRLCMTGTPLMNCATEIFPLIRFLDIAPYNDWAKFSEDIDRPILKWEGDMGAKGMRALQALLRTIMLRRTKRSSLDGQPILQLPPRTDLVAYAEFDNEQGEYYLALERQQRLRFNKYLKAGSVMKNYIDILVLLLRLRQACDHPHLIKDHGIVEGNSLDDADMTDLVMQLDDITVATIISLEEFECPMCHQKPDNPVHIHPCGHHICPQCFTASVNSGQPEGDVEDIDCVICPRQGCGVQITSRNFFMHNSFLGVHMAARSEASDEDPSVVESGGHDKEGLGALGAYDGPVVEWESEDWGSDKWAGDRGGLFVTQSPEPYAQCVPDGEVSKRNEGAVNGGGANERIDGDDDISMEATLGNGWSVLPQAREDPSDEGSHRFPGTAEDPIVLDEDDDMETFEGAGVMNLPEHDIGRVDAKHSRDIIDLTLSETASDVNDTDVSLIKRQRIGGNSSDEGGVDYERFRSALSFDNDMQDAADVQQIGEGDVVKDTNAELMYCNRNQFVSLAGLRSGATNATAQQRYHQHLRTEWVSSAKIDKVMELLNEIRKHQRKEKTLIFSLWPSFLDLLEVAIEASGFVHNRYDGTLRPDTRHAAVQNFQENPAVEVMLVSLTAGNAGLNLTAATQVIIAEPFWNPYVEEQAIDRAHRIGQQRAVTVHRVLIKETVEDRILQLQEKKKYLVDAALSEEGATYAGRLTVGELEGLFGM